MVTGEKDIGGEFEVVGESGVVVVVVVGFEVVGVEIVGESGVVDVVVVGVEVIGEIVGESGVESERGVVEERVESGGTAGAAHCTSEVVVDHSISRVVVSEVIVGGGGGYPDDVVGGVVGDINIESVRIAGVAHFTVV